MIEEIFKKGIFLIFVRIWGDGNSADLWVLEATLDAFDIHIKVINMDIWNQNKIIVLFYKWKIKMIQK
jgi:hypothetical protein